MPDGAHRLSTPIRFVVVTMDSALAGSAKRANEMLRAEIPGLEVVVHAADEWGTDAEALAACHADIATGDIVMATMLFLDDHIRAVQAPLAARRDNCDAMVGLMSGGEIMRLTRMGKFAMDKEATGFIAMLKKLRGSGSKGGKSSGHGQMKMVRRLPKLLKFIPGTAQDMRAYFLALQYWLGGSQDNFANLIRMLVSRYTTGERQRAVAEIKVAPPVDYPDVGLYHPDLPGRIVERLEQLPRGEAKAGTVGVLVLRSYLLSNNSRHYDGVIRALEARGLRPIVAFASGLDQREAIENYFTRDGRASVDALISLTGFSLVGGPAYNDSRAAEDVLAGLDVPYIGAHPVEFQTLRQWRADPRGLMPVEATMMVAIPELDGAIMPMTYGGRCGITEGAKPCDGCDGQNCARAMTSDPERAAKLAARVEKLVALRRTKRAERRVGIVIFNFPPNAGNTGTAAYLGVFESLHATLLAMKAGGYTVDVPSSVDALREMILVGNAAQYGALANVADRIDTDTHVRRQRWLPEIEAAWGAAPGRQNADGLGINILGAKFGNVIVGVQPGFGYEGDPMRLLFERGFAPTHAFTAFYRYLQEDFRADAVLHFGTHGALEFMPGKQTGLSGECWPDRLIDDLPNFYLYASNNPSEGMLAKRRAGAALISYLTPPVTKAGLYKGLADLKSSLDRWRSMDPDTLDEMRHSLAELIQAQAAMVDLAQAEPVWGESAETEISKLAPRLLEMEYALIPQGLHIVGQPMGAEARAEMIEAAGITDPDARARMDRLLATDTETPAILHALDGGYLHPAPGGDLLRTPEVLPTGRNLHGFDPFRLPSAFACKDGAAQAERLLARHLQEGTGLPETVAVVLWGSDNLKSEGGPIGQVLWLIGAEPRFDGYGRLCGAQLLPLSAIGRPRIDVVATLSGIFRDLLPLQTKLIAEACLLAAQADEPEEMNFIRKHTQDFIRKNGGSIEDAALRVFGNADGAYGSNVNALINSGAWNNEDELGDAFVKRKGFAYGVDGKPKLQTAVLADALTRIEVTYQNLDSIELGVTTVDQYFDTLGGITRAVRKARGGLAASVYIGDQTRGDGAVRSLQEQVALETRTRALNPKWYDALLKHGFEGVREIEAQVTNTLGWSATTGQVDPWVYQRLTETFVLDEAMRHRLAALNPAASSKIANRLIEAHERAYWTPSAEMLDQLRAAGEELEDRLEGVTAGAAA